MAVFDALSAISVPPEKAKAVVEAWEAEVRNTATKSDLVRAEKLLIQKTVDLGRELRGSIKELGDTVKTHGEQIHTLSQAIVTQGIELRAEMKEQNSSIRTEMKEQGSKLHAEIKEQGSEFRLAMEKQGGEFRLAMEKQGNQLRTELKEQGSDLKKSITELTAKVDKSLTLVYWQLGVVFLVFVIPVGKLVFDYVVKEWPL
ncbi:hypothetical protein C3F00_017135 [Pseudomonas sp. MWU13-2860]|nr:hypothetical protein C3F00_017135 [Pseudomonas sp. MWU13-2860]